VRVDAVRRRGSLAARGFHAIVLAAVLAGLAFGASAAAPEHMGADDIRGLWVDHRDPAKRKVGVWIDDCEGLVCGRIHWLKKPLYDGAPKLDQHNPDAALRNRPLCGLRILISFRRVKESSWAGGRIYNPSDGRTFNSTMQLEHDGSLRIRGYVGVALFGKTVEWVRPSEPIARCTEPDASVAAPSTIR
jgi:uncharacterized protein (DUF2147 family)